ncbi:MAG: hypothetical protein O7B32_03130 [Thaumarchaeota archaeon]|nr:hypothetical protein [Nitrososphaerota archaeon]MCZ6616289.1 hypothetical protein [Nitrososphaerota archaeon]MCZ6725262.1 hypothetical protein [Nitrososphaerota archaeon]
MAEPDKLEAVLWLTFTLGGFIAALFIPVIIVINNLAPGIGALSQEIVSYDSMLARLGPLARIFFLIVVVASIYHGMHRFKFVLFDIGLLKFKTPIYVLTYAIIVISAMIAIYSLILIPNP